MAVPEVALHLDPATELLVQQLAVAKQRAPRLILHEAVEQYLLREQQRVAFQQSAGAALHHYQQTGLHVTFEEADAWLAQLEEGESVPPPRCHE